MEPVARHCFEVSWEVCNKVGGIFTVVTSKALQMLQHYDGNYYLVGPYFPAKAAGNFEEQLPPGNLRPVFDLLKKEGIECHYGNWLIKGNPAVILLEFSHFAANRNSIKRQLWESYGLDTLNTEYHDFDEPVVWSWAVGRLLEEASKDLKGDIVAQFHEWLAGAGLLYAKMRKLPVATVFTTHATTLGRTLAGSGVDLYTVLNQIDPTAEAKQHGPSVWAKHQLEAAAAKASDVFTTVSEITGMEAEKLVGRKPDVLLPNGLDMEKFPTFEQLSIKHRLFKSKIQDFLLFYFFPYYSWDMDNTLIFFLAGRYEFHDKGIDIFIKALGKLNDRMKQESHPKTIVAFFWVPGNVRGIKPELLENRTFYADLKGSVEDSMDDVKHRLLHALITQRDVKKEILFDEDELADIKRKVLRFRRKGTPPVSTHDLYNEHEDAIVQTLFSVGLDNKEDDKVKAVYYPIYLTGADGLLDTSYYESMMGCHLGVFPSYYEPWGYTPLEAGALGVASVTTDLAGFGRFICKECAPGPLPGIWVLKRYGKPDDDVVDQLAETMHYYASLPTQQRVENKIAARTIANMADWKYFIERYIEAHDLAVKKLKS
ncbi:glycosyltransferase [Candidatus Woesearchaeota archaeon]|nr:glycosyltransferase [Candidatus Woesearchaeota archaeon]